MTVTIKKLTPPQVAAVREAFPINVRHGLVTHTASQVTFRDIPGKEPWRVSHVRKVIAQAAEAFPHAPLLPVLRKLDTRPDLVVEA